jgi:hypothetical protein
MPSVSISGIFMNAIIKSQPSRAMQLRVNTYIGQMEGISTQANEVNMESTGDTQDALDILTLRDSSRDRNN